jgi:rhodanese-related sulfurtransferase
MKKNEWILYLIVVATLGALVAVEGTRAAKLERQLPLEPQELYAKLARSQVKLQIIDARPLDEYEDAHVPGALPFPGCSTPVPAAQPHVLPSVPTIVVSASGDEGLFSACQGAFTTARNLAGGMEAWSDANLPEDSGEYVPPKPGAGGGCL